MHPRRKKEKKVDILKVRSEERKQLVQAGKDLKGYIKANILTLRVTRSSSVASFSYTCHSIVSFMILYLFYSQFKETMVQKRT